MAMQAVKAWVAVWWGPPVSPGSSFAWRHSKYQPSGLFVIVMDSVTWGLFKVVILCKAVVLDAGAAREGYNETAFVCLEGLFLLLHFVELPGV